MPGDLDEQFGTVWNQANQRSITILYGCTIMEYSGWKLRNVWAM